MAVMDKYLESLESWDPISAELITVRHTRYTIPLLARHLTDIKYPQSTKIHKVLKNIVKKKDEIPCDAQYSFRTRCRQLLDKWTTIIKEAGSEANEGEGATAKEGESAPAATVVEKAAEKKDEKEAAEDATNGEEANGEESKEAAEATGDKAEAEKDVSAPAAAVVEKAAEKEKGDKENVAAEAKEGEAAKA